MKTVVISGYYGYENIGDEALLASIISALKSEIPNLHIIVLSAAPQQTGVRYGVEAVNRMSFFSVLSALKRADLLISGGGSLLQDVTGPLTIPYYLGIVAMARMLGKPVMFYAQGIGPVKRQFGRMLIRLVADKVQMITLRDSASGKLLREIGVHNPPVEITADPVFGLDIDRPVETEELDKLYKSAGIAPPAGPVAGIFVREWQDFGGFKKAVAGLADYLSEKNRQVVFVPMQYPADVAPAREIAGMMRHSPLLVERGLTFTQMAGMVNSMDIVVGMRLHALIIAAVCAVPMVGISYDPKVSEFLETIGQPAVKDLESVTTEQLISKVEEVMANTEAVRKNLSGLRTELRQKALRNSQIAAQLLNHSQ